MNSFKLLNSLKSVAYFVKCCHSGKISSACVVIGTDVYSCLATTYFLSNNPGNEVSISVMLHRW